MQQQQHCCAWFVVRSHLELLVAAAEGTVGARVDAVVGDVQRSKEHDAVAVDAVLDGKGRVIHHLHHVLVVGINVEQGGALGQGQTLDVLGLACRAAQ